jgi:hypothetical protein
LTHDQVRLIGTVELAWRKLETVVLAGQEKYEADREKSEAKKMVADQSSSTNTRENATVKAKIEIVGDFADMEKVRDFMISLATKNTSASSLNP